MDDNTGVDMVIFAGDLYLHAQGLIDALIQIAIEVADDGTDEVNVAQAAAFYQLAAQLEAIGNDIIDTPGVPDVATFLTEDAAHRYMAAVEEVDELRGIFENPTTP